VVALASALIPSIADSEPNPWQNVSLCQALEQGKLPREMNGYQEMNSSSTEETPLPADPPGKEDAADKEGAEGSQSPNNGAPPLPVEPPVKEDASDKEGAEGSKRPKKEALTLPAVPLGKGGGVTEHDWSDRRNSPRKQVHWRVKLKHDTASGQVTTDGKALDASMTGLSVMCDLNLAETTRLILTISLPAAKPRNTFHDVQISATVVNSIYAQGEFRLGLQFTKFHGQAKEELTAILA
jgi:hypothetical protein